MSARPLRFLVPLVFALGCGDPERAWIALPEVNDARAFVLAYGTAAERTITAIDAADPGAQTVPLKSPEARVEVWAYQATLEDLHLSAGTLREDPTGSALPKAGGRFVLDRSTVAWVDDPAPELLASALLVKTTNCTPFDVVTRDLGPGRTVFLEPLPDGRLLHGFTLDVNRASTFRVIDSEGGVEVLSPPPVSDIATGAIVGDTLWVAASEALVSALPLADLTVRSSSATTLRAWDAMDGGRSGGDTEIVLASTSGELVRFDGRAFVSLAPPTAAYERGASVLWQGPGDVFLATEFQRTILHYVDGRIVQEPLPGIRGAPTAVAPSARYGLLAGSSLAEIFARSGSSWRALATLPDLIDVTAVLELPKGLLVGGPGQLREWLEQEGTFCPPLEAPQDMTYRSFGRVGSLIVAAGWPPTLARPSYLVLIRPR
ncbi:MAG: hypothetical protein IT384_09685 [Deltaproteobacteria bacterium]|nr:hypothetical protein [Deltaproteobacteria bacterium]